MARIVFWAPAGGASVQIGGVGVGVEIGQIEQLRRRGRGLGFALAAIGGQDHVRVGQGQGGHACLSRGRRTWKGNSEAREGERGRKREKGNKNNGKNKGQ